MCDNRLAAVFGNFNTDDIPQDIKPFGEGHINLTYLVTCENGRRYIMQKINDKIFLNIPELMENMVGVTSFLRDKIIAAGGDPNRETLNYILTRDGKCFYDDGEGGYWRLCLFVEDTVCLQGVRCPQDFYNSAVAFGNFQRLLADYPAHTLHETIKDFHNTKSRYAALKDAISRDPLGRVKDVQAEIEFALTHEADGAVLVDLLEDGKLPLRVTHNDTKLNNILLDKNSGLAICVIDLDTVMPGLAATDFGDAIRFGANTSAEDEQDLSKVRLDLELYETYTEGFLKGCNGSLTKPEIDTLPHGAKIMCLECGVRFLTDYIDGDNYFRIHREGHNLDRCRTQFKLVSEIDKYWNELCDITAKHAE